jgi:hypothetical protein
MRPLWFVDGAQTKRGPGLGPLFVWFFSGKWRSPKRTYFLSAAGAAGAGFTISSSSISN